MSHKPYYPRPWQIPGLLSGEITRVIVPIKGLYPDDNPVGRGKYHPRRSNKDGQEYPAPEVYGTWGDDWDIPAPYQPGDVLAGKEAWGLDAFSGSLIDPTINYRVDFAQRCPDPRKLNLRERNQLARDCGKGWLPAITMPAWAVRLHLRVLTVEAVRVAEIGGKACVEAGMPIPTQSHGMHPPPAEQFQKRYTADHGPDAWDGWAWSVQVEQINHE